MGRGNLDIDQIQDACRQGDGTKVATAKGAFTSGNLLKAGTGGAVEDAGIAAAPGGAVYTPSLLAAPPALGDWTQVNYGGSASDNEGGFIYLEAPASATFSLRMLTLPLSNQVFTLSATFRQSFPYANSYAAGICLRDSTSGKVVAFYAGSFGTGGSMRTGAHNYNSPTSYNGNIFEGTWPSYLSNVAYRIKQTSTNRIYYCSNDDGLHWRELFSTAKDAFLVPDQVGIFADSENTASVAAITLNGWTLTYP